MKITKNRKREFQSVSRPEGIERILSNYVNFNELYEKNSMEKIPVIFISRLNDTTLLLNFNNKIESDELKIYTIGNRYMEFDLQMIKKVESHNGNNYIMRINKCKIANDKRRSERFDSSDWNLHVNHITAMNVQEDPIDIINSVKFQVFFQNCVKDLDEYDLKKTFLKNDENLSVEMRYAIETKGSLYIDDFNKRGNIINFDADSFAKNPDMSDQLEKRFIELQKQYKSLFIKPIEYRAIDNKLFPIGYIMIATKERILGTEDIQKIESVVEETSQKIRNANYKTHESKGNVLNISACGALVEISDIELCKKLSKLDWLLFSLVFHLQQPLRISGEIVYVYEKDNNSNIIGFDFKGSEFGSMSQKLIQEKIDWTVNLNAVNQ